MQVVDEERMIERRRRFLMVMKFTMYLLQVLACLSTIASFSRLLDQFKLPPFFILIPGLLVLLVGLERCYLTDDANLSSIIRGSVTGFLSAFYATVVNDYFSHPVHTSHNKLLLSLGQYEFLHIPVIVGTLMCLFCITFSQFPPVTITILSFALAVCSMALFSLGSIFFQPDTATINTTHALVVFVVVFLAGLMPFVNLKRRWWLFVLTLFILSCIWQNHNLDSTQWDWSLNRFPVAGSLTPLISLFLVDIVQLVSDKEVNNTFNRRRKRSNAGYDEDDVENKYKTYYKGDTGGDEDDGDSVTNALTWHCVCYVMERTTLTLMMEKQHKGKLVTDTWMCCLGMFFLFIVFVNYRQLSLSSKIILTFFALLLYFCIGITSGMISNGYFFDSVLGILFITISSEDLND